MDTEIKMLTEQQVKAVYEQEMMSDFPENERKPLNIILKLISEECYVCYGLWQENQLLGYAFFWKEPGWDYILLDYLAIVRGHRASGLGEQFVKQLFAHVQSYKGIVAEVEALTEGIPEEERKIREKRLRFYQRLGFIKFDFYCRVLGVEYAMHVYPLDSFQTAQLEKAAAETERRMYRRWLPEDRYKAEVDVRL